MANTVVDEPKPKNYMTGKKHPHTVEAKALSTQGAVALGTVLAGAGVAVAATAFALPELAAFGMAAGIAGAALKYKDTVNERDRLNK